MRVPLLRFVRTRRAARLAVVLLAVVTWLVVHGLAAHADAARAAWGPGPIVVVARHRIEAGTVIGPADVERRRLPAAVVPDGALTELAPGARAGTVVERGEVLVGDRVGRGHLAPPDTRALAVPLGDARLPLQPGDRVDVVGLANADTGGVTVVATDAVVLSVSDTSATVAVAPAEETAAAAAVHSGFAVLALRPAA